MRIPIPASSRYPVEHERDASNLGENLSGLHRQNVLTTLVLRDIAFWAYRMKTNPVYYHCPVQPFKCKETSSIPRIWPSKHVARLRIFDDMIVGRSISRR